MTEKSTSNSGMALGIAGLVLGIIAIPLGIIPCTFWAGLIFGVIGIILSSVGLTMANAKNAEKNLIIIALVCSIIGTSFAALWGLVFSGAKKNSQHFIENVIDQFKNDEEVQDALDDFKEEFEDAVREQENNEDSTLSL